MTQLLLRKYLTKFQNAPASHLTAFLVLHEITAILPIPLVFYALQHSQWTSSFDLSEELLKKGDRFIGKVRGYVGLKPLESGSQTAVNLATAYALVKVLMPVRLAASAALTPWFAGRFVQPLTRFFRPFQKG